jgi:hypothetical protein
MLKVYENYALNFIASITFSELGPERYIFLYDSETELRRYLDKCAIDPELSFDGRNRDNIKEKLRLTRKRMELRGMAELEGFAVSLVNLDFSKIGKAA